MDVENATSCCVINKKNLKGFHSQVNLPFDFKSRSVIYEGYHLGVNAQQIDDRQDIDTFMKGYGWSKQIY